MGDITQYGKAAANRLATATQRGQMAPAAVSKLAGITAGAQPNVLEGVTGTSPIVAGAIAAKLQAISILASSAANAGSMSAADFTKLLNLLGIYNILPPLNMTGNTLTMLAATALQAGYMSSAHFSALAALISAGTGTFYGVRARNNANISLTSATDTALPFNTHTLQVNDASAPHSNTVNTSRFIATKAGWWRCLAHGEFAASAGGTYRRLGILKGGVTYLGFGESPPNGATNTTHVVAEDLSKFAVNEYVEIIGKQDAGAALNILSGSDHSPVVSWEFVGL